MEEIYISKSDLELLLLKNTIPSEIRDKVGIGVTSISDLIELIEYRRKKENDLTNRVSDLCKEYIEKGILNVAEVDQHVLKMNLFDEEVWEKFASVKADPLIILRYVSLKKFDETVWWSEAIFEQMKSIYE
jgi:hypothetical protein